MCRDWPNIVTGYFDGATDIDFVHVFACSCMCVCLCLSSVYEPFAYDNSDKMKYVQLLQLSATSDPAFQKRSDKSQN